MHTKYTYHDSTLVAATQTSSGDLVLELELCPGYDVRDGPATLMLHDICNSRFARVAINYLAHRISNGIYDEFLGLRPGVRGGFVVMFNDWSFFVDAKSFTEM